MRVAEEGERVELELRASPAFASGPEGRSLGPPAAVRRSDRRTRPDAAESDREHAMGTRERDTQAEQERRALDGTAQQQQERLTRPRVPLDGDAEIINNPVIINK
jgi:hypothetical protein